MTTHVGCENYSLAAIQNFYATEYPTLHGTSPAVQAQNLALVERMQQFAAAEASPAILAVQLMGSRAQGSAGLESDADVAVVHFGRSYDKPLGKFQAGLYNAMQPIRKDIWGGLMKHHLQLDIPEDPAAFNRWVATAPDDTVALFEPGVYHTPALQLCAAAVTTMLASSRNRATSWELLRERHVESYVAANPWRAGYKIARRIGSKLASGQILTPDIIQARIDRFGLPKDFDEYHQPLEAWAKTHAEEQAGTTAHALYQKACKQQ